MSDLENWGRTVAVLAALYGIKPWEVEKLSDEQIAMLMEESGYIRHLRDLPMLAYHFMKMGEEGHKALVEDYEAQMLERKKAEKAGIPYTPSSKNPIQTKAWQYFALAPYGLLEEASSAAILDLPISPAAAEGIVRMVEAGKCPSRAWRDQLNKEPTKLWPSFVAKAAEYQN